MTEGSDSVGGSEEQCATMIMSRISPREGVLPGATLFMFIHWLGRVMSCLCRVCMGLSRLGAVLMFHVHVSHVHLCVHRNLLMHAAGPRHLGAASVNAA